MFGLSFGELVMLLLVAVVVLGPKELPKYLRKAGQLAGRLRQMAYDMREKSGIDEVIRSEGLDRDIAEIRRLATFARSELGGVMSVVRSTANSARLDDVPGSPYVRAPQATLPGVPGVPGLPGLPAATSPANGAASPASPALGSGPARAASVPFAHSVVTAIDREREYPTGGPDTYGALPETADVYGGDLPASPLAGDPVYAAGADAAVDEEARS